VPAPETPPRPSEWRDGWIWVPLKEMTPTGLVKGVLRGAGRRLSLKAIMETIAGLGVDNVNAGSVANIGTRLASLKVIDRSDDGWLLGSPQTAAVLHEDSAWGLPEVFDRQEITAYRRTGIRHLLRANPDGLLIAQIDGMLDDCEWMHAPHNKDQVKLDLKVLGMAGEVQRLRGGKWRFRQEGS